MIEMSRPRKMTEAQFKDWFKQQAKVTREGCWLWQRPLMSNGYGQVTYQGKSKLVHRLAYMLWKGDLPEYSKENVLSHLCNIRHCYNPDHLELTTQEANMNNSHSHMKYILGVSVNNDIHSRLKSDADMMNMSVAELVGKLITNTYTQSESVIH